ncbi:HGG motif-containing thioesterase [Ceraceosorus bombacis]|uniref:HGG motif-containing thioesterase n=2 Tax=Ceraceosorus TaxID=401624 RepID=A0A0P1BSN5_9BASI|nr:hypothetical protein IE81DRAFT_322735 [Ceraceosorus guamensis]PWN43032.1 hypothetical protein IE81DRAFT_322735 [Ceraceosorus guamensis]CEH19390.1 HGG motif-containing thioesterase [Ceraceosorus bombacis]
MPAPQLQSIDGAKKAIQDILEAMSSPESPGFSRYALDPSVSLTHLSRSEDQKSAKVVLKMRINEGMANQLGNLHGGAGATIVDCATSMVLYLHTSGISGDPWSYLGVSQSIQMLYFAPTPVGAWVDIEVNSLTVGKSVAAIQCDIWLKDAEDGKRLRRTTSGTHTKIDNSSQAKM